MNTYQSQGIVIQAIAFRDYDQILTVFTQEAGLIKAIIKGSNRKKKNSGGGLTPLMRVDMTWSDGKGDLAKAEEVVPLQHYSAIRQNLDLLEAGCDLLHAIKASQLVGKAVPALYQLLLIYLEKLPEVTHPAILTTSFRLKILKHEGLLSFPLQCFECQQVLSSAMQHGGSIYCALHAPFGGELLTEEDVAIMDLLTNSLSFSTLSQVKLPVALPRKIVYLFTAANE